MTAVSRAGGARVPVSPSPHPRRWLGLTVLCASLLIVVMDLTVLNVALPAIAGDLRPSSVQQLWIVDSYGLAVAGLLVTASGLADRFGRRRMLLTGYAVFGVVPLLVIFANSPEWLIVLRVLLGVGGALIMPSTMSMIRDLFTDGKERAMALGVWAAMAAVGGGLGPIVGGVLVQTFDWHAAFLFNTPVMIVAAAFALVILPESHGKAVPWDFVGIFLSIMGMSAAMYTIKVAGRYGFFDAQTCVAGLTALVALGWFARRSLRRAEPLLDLRLLRRRPVTAGLLCALTSSIAMAALMLLLAQWMQLVQGYSPIETGLRLLPMAIVSGVLSPLAPRIAQTIGARNVMVSGLVVGGAGFGLLYLGGEHISFGLVAACQVLVGASMATLAIGSAVILSSVPAERSGNAAAMEETSFEIGGALGVAALGSIAAVVFQRALSVADLDLSASDTAAAHESLGGAMSIAQRMGPAGAELASRAQLAFTDGLAMAGLVGGAVMLLTAIVVWWMTPRHLTVEGEH